jgi:hypothetical protein
MKTEHELRSQYIDILDNGDDASMMNLITQLDAAYQAGSPPARFVAEARQLIKGRCTERQRGIHYPTFGLGRFIGERRLIGMATVLLAAVLITAGIAFAAATSVIRVWPPGKSPAPNVVFITNSLPPLSYQRFRALDPARAAHQRGLPVAYLARVPKALKGSVGVQIFVPKPCPKSNTPVARVCAAARHAGPLAVPERIRSLVRYHGSHTLLIALFQLAPAVEKHPVLLGERTVHLPNGQDAWINVAPESVESNWVTMVRGNYIVSLYSDRPMRAVQRMATTVKLSPPSGKPNRRGIPSSWPAPLPAATQITGVDIVLIGTVSHGPSTRGPHLTYSFTFGNRGSGHEHKLRFTLVLPPGLVFAGHSSRRRHTIWCGSGNGGFAGDLPLLINDERAFGRGMAVRAAWTENGRSRRHVFHFDFSPPHPRQRSKNAASVESSKAMVGLLLVPKKHTTCTPKPTTASVPAPAGLSIARISRPPWSLAGSVAVVFPGSCRSPYTKMSPALLKRLKQLESAPIWFKVLSQVEYSGPGGTVNLVTATASPEAVSVGPGLGNAAGSRAYGTPMWSLMGTPSILQWSNGNTIVQMSSSDLTIDQMKALVPGVVVS